MSKLGDSLEKGLEIPAFSQESLSNLISSNDGILSKELDTEAKISIQVEANLDWYVPIDDSTCFRVPTYYLPVERFVGEEVNGIIKEIFKEALNIQKIASGDIPEHHHHYGYSIFRKLATAVARLEKLRAVEQAMDDYFKTFDREFDDARMFIDRLIKDGKKKLSNVSIRWEYKKWGGDLGPGGDFKRYDSKKLSELVGGEELFNQAVQQSLQFDVFEYIDEYAKRDKSEISEDELTSEQQAKKKTRVEKPIVLSLSARGGMSRPMSASMANYFYDFDDGAYDLVRVDNMQEFVWLMDEWREKDLLKDVSYIFINSAPPYFYGDSIEQFQLMMKYGIYNRGLTGRGLDYDGGCVDDIKGIIRLIKGEYPELPNPIALCDGGYVLGGYTDDDIVMPISEWSDDRDSRITKIKQLVQTKKSQQN